MARRLILVGKVALGPCGIGYQTPVPIDADAATSSKAVRELRATIIVHTPNKNGA